MEVDVFEEIPFEPDVRRLLSRLRMKPESPHFDAVRELLDRAISAARPRAVAGIAYIGARNGDSIEAEGVTFRSRILSVNVGEAHRVFPHIATCGSEIESLTASLVDPFERFVVEEVKLAALVAARDFAARRIDERHRPGSVSLMSPGSLEDWPISQQRELFSLFGDVESLIGVTLTESCLMLPIKSASGIWFPTEKRFESCQLCPREICPDRRAKYDAEALARSQQS